MLAIMICGHGCVRIRLSKSLLLLISGSDMSPYLLIKIRYVFIKILYFMLYFLSGERAIYLDRNNDIEGYAGRNKET